MMPPPLTQQALSDNRERYRWWRQEPAETDDRPRGAAVYSDGGTTRRQHDPTVCYYCGVPATSIDHVVPKSLLDDWRRLGDLENLRLATGRGRVLTVPSCQQCNSMLGGRYDATLADRKARLKARLRKRYARALAMPDWTPEELAALGPRLRAHIEAGLGLRDYVRRRLAW